MKGLGFKIQGRDKSFNKNVERLKKNKIISPSAVIGFWPANSDGDDILIFKDNYLIHSKVIPIGSRLVTKDLAAYLQTSIAEAERVKIEHVSAFSDFADDSKVFEVQIPNDDLKKNVNEKEISKIVELRFEDVIDQIEVQLKNIGKSITDFKSGIKLSGGGSKIRNLDLLFKKHFADVPPHTPHETKAKFAWFYAKGRLA